MLGLDRLGLVVNACIELAGFDLEGIDTIFELLILRFGFVEAMYERNRLRSGSWEQVALPTSDPDAP
ncbi:hypothetical protein [Halogranum rubrum]|uniref:hypothetical protein n=1 Tax=Halogranum rubrum TaxID=553466 RepID=UPI001ED8C0DB|nr:hypothetical protein [Halogranum salarium]